ncbi:oxidoreductase [Pokkaliibacter plantistimulans]|uniref:Oxidoreductase n=1 Tax=Proteobacteria bacterium 228 TaxID=2083153 RepID=A0A2S5KPN0_9PROT|nr:PDR/VanB family oxidoreductase [Pokkaliibacter plantistimulans]PPC76682.1 oxidoreductase [Pokkaliibacter plantistimulans]
MSEVMSDLLKVVVRRREQHGEAVIALELVDPNGQPLPAFEAGAHIDLHLGEGLVRQYSLCGDPADTSAYRLGVLRDPQSRGGSVAAHALQESSEVQISAPRNLFPLASNAGHSLLIGAGIGITPMIAMAYALHRAGQSFELYYCGRSRQSSAFVEDLLHSPFAAQVRLHFTAEHGGARLDLPQLLAGVAADHTHLYVCGPVSFMDAVISAGQQRGLADSQIHREFFQVEVDSHGDSFEVVAERSGKTLTVAGDQTIVEALAEAGIRVKVSCEQGVCGSCLCDVLEGEPDHRDVYLTDDEKADNDQMTLCCSRARSPRLVLDI